MNASNSFSPNDETALLDHLYRVPVERRVLSNGLTLAHRADFSADVVSVQFWIKTGSIHEGELLGSGLSHYLEHLLFKGTAKREGRDISAEIHALGGAVNAYTTFDRTVYYIDAPADAFDAAVDILADMVFDSRLPEAEVERERDVILREIDMGTDDPDRQLMQSMFRTAFRSHPYREPVIGHRELFERVSRDELRSYYKSRYQPNNVVVAVAGAVSRSRCVEAIEARLGAYPRGRLASAFIPEEEAQLAPRENFVGGDYNVFRGALAFKVPHLSHEDAPKLDALAHALGGGESSLLWRRMRNEAKLVHYIDCRNWSPGRSGLLWISYVCDPDRAGEVADRLNAVLAEVARRGLEPSVIAKARRQALSAEINGRKTMSGQASRLGLAEVVIGDLHYGRRYLRRLSEVDAADVKEVAAKYLVEATRTAVSLGPADSARSAGDVNESLEGRAPTERLPMEGGATLLLQHDPRLPKVHIRCLMLGGGAYEGAGKRGISTIMAELMTKDTEARTADEVAERVESLGGRFASSVGDNTVGLSLEVLPTDLETAVGLLGDALTAPVFADETLTRELASQISYLQEEDDDILERGFRRLREEFFGSHPLSVGADGLIRHLEGLTRDDVRAHHAALVKAENLIVSVCGDFDRDALPGWLKPLMEERVSRGGFERKRASALAPVEPRRMEEAMSREQTVVLQGYADAGVLDECYPVAEMLNELFSGMSSRLFEQIREERGMAYFVGSTRVVGLHEGMFALYAGTHPEHADEVSREMDAELARVAAGEVAPEELERCRTRLKAGRVMGRQTIGSRAMHVALNEAYGLPLDDDAEYVAKLKAVDAAALSRFVREKMRPERKLEFRLGPQGKSSTFAV